MSLFLVVVLLLAPVAFAPNAAAGGTLTFQYVAGSVDGAGTPIHWSYYCTPAHHGQVLINPFNIFNEPGLDVWAYAGCWVREDVHGSKYSAWGGMSVPFEAEDLGGAYAVVADDLVDTPYIFVGLRQFDFVSGGCGFTSGALPAAPPVVARKYWGLEPGYLLDVMYYANHVELDDQKVCIGSSGESTIAWGA